MDPIDDDFGDLYADAEVQASSALNGAMVFTKPYIEPGDDINCNAKSGVNLEENTKKPVPVTRDSTRCVGDGPTGNAASYEPEATDSDDDLNIVLNDERSEVPSVTGGTSWRSCGHDEDEHNDGRVGAEENGSGKNQLGDQCIRPHVSAIPSNMRVNGSMKMENSMNNGCNQIKNSCISRFSNACADRVPPFPQFGNGFSLPWYRTIFDVNINSFEEKPWRNPGADISDFFNFGFNEKSWKKYCKSLRQSYEFGCGHVKLVEESVEDRTRVEPSSISADGGKMPLTLPKGRAIEVEDGTVERIPSTDLRRLPDRDSNAVIQIKVDDSTGDLSGLTNEEPEHSNCRLNEDVYLDNNRDFHSLVGSSGEQTSEGSLGENRTSSGEQSDPKVNVCSAEAIIRPMQMINEEEKEVQSNSDDSDPHAVETELSLGDRVHFSPTPSCSGGRYEESSDSECDSLRDTVLGNRYEIHTPSRKTELQESDTSDHKKCKRNSIKMGQKNGKRHSRPKSSNQEQQKRHCVRPHFAAQGDANPEYNNDGRKRSHVRDKSPLHKSRTYHSSRPRFVSARNENDKNAFRVSDSEGFYDRVYTSLDYRRRKERSRYFGYYSKKESADDRARARSYGYENERVFEVHTKNAHSNYPRRESHWSFREEVGPYGRNYDEAGYFHERRAIVDNENNRDRDWCHSRRELSFEDTTLLNYRESRWLSSKYLSDYGGGPHKWRQENETLQSTNRNDYDGHLHHHGHKDDLLRERYGMSIRLADRERHSFVEPRGREFLVYGREVDLNLNRFFTKETANEYGRTEDARASSSLSFRKSRSAKGARNDVWENDINGPRVTETYDRQSSQMYGRRFSYMVDTEHNRVNQGDLSYSERGRYSLGYEVEDLTKDLMRCDNKLYTDEVLEPNRRTSTRDWVSTKHRFSHDEMHIDDTENGYYRYKMMNEENDLSNFNRNEGFLHAEEHEQAFQRCSDSVNSIGRKGKFERRSSNGRRLELNGRDEKKGKIFANARDSNEHSRAKALIPRKESNKRTEKQLVKFPVSEQMDIEEGQIMEEPSDMTKRASCTEDLSNGNKIEIDKQRIQETIAKMEKRRARFKEPVTVTKEPKTVTFDPRVEPGVETDETKQHRPTRKRLWSGN